jgi:uncharacterized protein involved in exopolysaccharide biosynthesis
MNEDKHEVLNFLKLQAELASTRHKETIGCFESRIDNIEALLLATRETLAQFRTETKEEFVQIRVELKECFDELKRDFSMLDMEHMELHRKIETQNVSSLARRVAALEKQVANLSEQLTQR